jgi:hypothetical protein
MRKIKKIKVYLGILIAGLASFWVALLIATQIFGFSVIGLITEYGVDETYTLGANVIIIGHLIIGLQIGLVLKYKFPEYKKNVIKALDYAGKGFSGGLCIFLIITNIIFSSWYLTSLPFLVELMNDREKAPYLTWVGNTSTSICVSWETNQPIESYIEYGLTNITLGTNVTAGTGKNEKNHTIFLNNLQPNTKYFYRVNGINKIYNFRTMAHPSQTKTVRFILYGDNRYDTHILAGPFKDSCFHTAILKKIIENQIRSDGEFDFNFTLNVGDVVLSGGVDYNWNQFHREISCLAPYRAYMIACGNHEYYQGNEEGGPNEAANMHKYWTYNNSSGDELNYWFTVGNCMFVVYNTGQYGTLKPSQVAWINETLESYRNNYDWAFLVNHHPYYGCGQPSSNISTMIMETIKKYNISVSLTGHEHNYQRYHDSILNWTHIVSGGGGADLSERCTRYPLNFSASLYHYMVWEVTGNSSYVQTFNLNNEIIDNFNLYI